MTNEQMPASPMELPTSSEQYEAPHIESVLTPDDLEREVAYAGLVAISPGQFA